MSLPQLPNDGIFPVSYSSHHHLGDIMSCGRVDIARTIDTQTELWLSCAQINMMGKHHQVSLLYKIRSWISNYALSFSVGCNYLSMALIHLTLVPHICVSEFGQH